MLVNEIIKHTILQYRRKDTNIFPQSSFKIVLILIKTVHLWKVMNEESISKWAPIKGTEILTS